MALRDLQQQWETILFLESKVHVSDTWAKLAKEMYWLTFAVIRLTYMQLEQENFQLGPLSRYWIEGVVVDDTFIASVRQVIVCNLLPRFLTMRLAQVQMRCVLG